MLPRNRKSYRKGKAMNEQNLFDTARRLLTDWKGGSYVFGTGVVDELGALVRRFGRRALVVASQRHSRQWLERAMASMKAAGVEFVTPAPAPGARPNAPREDVYRLESYILHHKPDCVVAIGGGSAIDACKAAVVLAGLGAAVTPELEPYFGTGLVTKALEETGAGLIPLIAVETAASSGSHLTKYSNVTDIAAGQKLLIVDPAITPAAALFDYGVTASLPLKTTLDGALDGMAHTFEAYCGAKPETIDLLEKLTVTCLELVLEYAPKLCADPADAQAREALGLATDLGGYAIMVGGTSGAHLTSFSLVDVASHGLACGIMNPYYTVFYAPAIARQLKVVSGVLKRRGLISENSAAQTDRAMAEAVARGMMAFNAALGLPVRLTQLPGFTEEHVRRILAAAKAPALSMKLQNMPVPMTAEDVDTYMEPILRAAMDGDLTRIRNR